MKTSGWVGDQMVEFESGMKQSLRDQLRTTTSKQGLETVWNSILAARDMSNNTFNKCKRVYETKLGEFA